LARERYDFISREEIPKFQIHLSRTLSREGSRFDLVLFRFNRIDDPHVEPTGGLRKRASAVLAQVTFAIRGGVYIVALLTMGAAQDTFPLRAKNKKDLLPREQSVLETELADPFTPASLSHPPLFIHEDPDLRPGEESHPDREHSKFGRFVGFHGRKEVYPTSREGRILGA